MKCIDWLRRVFKRGCCHEFVTCDIKHLKHPHPAEPATRGYFEWKEYYQELEAYRRLNHVSCECRKCGQVLYVNRYTQQRIEQEQRT
ncbi:hypothetical protein SIPHO063v1_p0028 [Vibrio phage PS10B.1]|nr:hypothetical protein SIPHO063v1_p0028 [Vibrio phage PS10B.1]